MGLGEGLNLINQPIRGRRSQVFQPCSYIHEEKAGPKTRP